MLTVRTILSLTRREAEGMFKPLGSHHDRPAVSIPTKDKAPPGEPVKAILGSTLWKAVLRMQKRNR